jgi:hypothetical protein
VAVDYTLLLALGGQFIIGFFQLSQLNLRQPFEVDHSTHSDSKPVYENKNRACKMHLAKNLLRTSTNCSGTPQNCSRCVINYNGSLM